MLKDIAISPKIITPLKIQYTGLGGIIDSL